MITVVSFVTNSPISWCSGCRPSVRVPNKMLDLLLSVHKLKPQHIKNIFTFRKITNMEQLSNLGSDLINRSTIFKRHEVRCESHNGAQASSPTHLPHQATSHSIGETLTNLNKTSTIYGFHDTHHQEMHHDQHAGEKHMAANATHRDDKLVETLSHLKDESSIYDRNVRRNDFLHSQS